MVTHHIIALWITFPPQRPCSTVCRRALSSGTHKPSSQDWRGSWKSVTSKIQVTVLPMMALPHFVQLSDIWLLRGQSRICLLTCFCSDLLIFLFPAAFNSLSPVKLMDRLGNHALLKKRIKKAMSCQADFRDDSPCIWKVANHETPVSP